MSKSTAVSTPRRLAGSAALLATAAGLGTIAVHDLHWIEWALLGCSGVVAVAGVGLARRSLLTQVLSRATAWLVFAPAAMVTAVSAVVSHSHVDLVAAGLAATSGAALLLARPMLHTAEAKATFAPVGYRRWLLAASTAASAAGLTAGMIAFDMMRWSGDRAAGLAIGALGVSLLASAVGVLRMRAWGILLGAATSIATLLAALVVRDAASLVFALAALPGMMLALPVLLAKRARDKDVSAARTRVAFDEAHVSPARYRIAADDGSHTPAAATADEEADERADARTTASRRATLSV